MATDSYAAPTKFAVPASIVRAVGNGLTQDKLMELALAQAPNPERLRAADPFFGAAIISSDRVDSYSTSMDPETTLRNFATDAIEGVSVLDSHDSHRLGFGRSIFGQVDDKDPAFRTTAWWYTPRGVGTSTGGKTDDYIDNIEMGIYKDVSVGFRSLGKESVVECSICQRDMFGWDCPHWPGGTYMVHVDPEDEKSAEVERVAVGKIVNFGLAEFSYVYKGANEDATHSGTLSVPESKVRMYVNAGELTRKQGSELERMYGGTIPNLSRLHDTYPGIELNLKPDDPEEQDDMTWTDHSRAAFESAYGRAVSAEDEALDPIDAFAIAAGLETERYVGSVTRADHDAMVAERDALKVDVDRLTPLAETGSKALENATELAFKAASRAALDPDKFDEKRVRRMLSGLELDDLVAFADERSAEADAKLAVGDGGRKVRVPQDNYSLNEEGEPTPIQQRRAANYAAR